MVETQKHKRLFSPFLCIFFLLFATVGLVPGQTTVELRGTLFDQADALIVNAVVELHGRQLYTTRTNAQGQYRFSSVVPGKYTLKITAEGFAAFSQEIDLSSRLPTLLNVKLRILLIDSIEVRNDAASISTEPADNLSGLTLSQEDLQALPDNPSELLRILRLMAGGTGGAYPVAIYVDGFPQNGRIPPKSAIQMIRINSNPFAAEFSEPGRGRIEITTKPGTDKFHGEFAFNFNDSALNARNAFAAVRAPQQTKNYSGYFNGPIIRNRWDFLVYAGVWQQDENSVVNAIVLNPRTLLAQPFTATAIAPIDNRDFSLNSNLLLTNKQTIGFGYSYSGGGAKNQGLQGGFDLLERAFNTSSRNDTLRFSLTSIPSAHLLNQIRVQLKRYRFAAQSLDPSPAILVFGAFNAGGNQGSLFSQVFNRSLQAVDLLSYTRKRHTLKLGFRADAVDLDNLNRSNFNGTFTFGTDFERDALGNPLFGANQLLVVITPLEHYRRTLLGLPGYRPSQFSIIRGNPSVNLSQREISWFIQDDWRVSNRLTLSYGLRHEFQTNLEDRLNFAPRFGLAWAPGKNRKAVIRFGAGLFYNNLDPGITFDTIRLDGKHQQEILIEQPAFFPNIPAEVSSTTTQPSILRKKADGLNAPYLMISSISYERQLPWKMLASASYTWQRGIHLLRTRNINSPFPAAPGRPFPDLGPVLQFESTATSTRHELKLSLQTRVNRRLNLFGNYALASARTDTEGPYFAPANSYDLANEFARAGSDQRHRLFVGGSLSLAWDLRFNPFLFVSSGRPFNITTGRDNNGDTFFTDRPALVSADTPGAIVTRFGAFISTPMPGAQIIDRNFGEGPGQVNMNMSFSKTFSFNLPLTARSGQASKTSGAKLNPANGGDSGSTSVNGTAEAPAVYLTVSVEIDNLLNHTNLAGFNGVLTSPFFGRANRALEARRILLGARLSF